MELDGCKRVNAMVPRSSHLSIKYKVYLAVWHKAGGIVRVLRCVWFNYGQRVPSIGLQGSECSRF